MKEYFKKLERGEKIAIFLIVAVVLVGIFVRTYHFSDWLRFNADQSRDVSLAIKAIGNNEWPLLGPKAGGTDFKLGPVFYHFQIASMKIFGATPQAGAYPDLLFSILAIVVFYLLVKTYFDPKISIAITWLYTVSYFVIKYSRFAWNPNATPFFVMLYLLSMYRMATAEKSKKMLWAILAGIGLGIVVQLHTSLLIIMPVLTLIIFAFFVKKELVKKTAIACVLAVAILVNVPQIISEVENRGANLDQLIAGATKKSGRNSSLGKSLFLDLTCHIKANSHILSSLDNEDDCGYGSFGEIWKKISNKKKAISDRAIFTGLLLFSSLFSVSGYALIVRGARKEKNWNKKLFLMLIALYAGLFFLFSITWATELSVRFFLPLAFVPFILLGLWMKFLAEKTKRGLLVILIMMAIFSFTNLHKIYGSFRDLRFGGREINGDFDYMTLGEGKYIVDFMEKNSQGEKTVYVDAQAGYLFKLIKSIRFLAKEDGLKIIQLEKEIKLASGSRLFYIKSADKGCKLSDKILKKYEVEQCALYRQFSVFSLKVK